MTLYCPNIIFHSAMVLEPLFISAAVLHSEGELQWLLHLPGT